MTTSQAARVIGCTSSQVGRLIRLGKLKARKVPTAHGTYYYEIELREARRYARTETHGYPRGQSRK